MDFVFRKAQRSQVSLKLAITGPTGSGKTFSALRLATGLMEGSEKRVCVIDTEQGSASLYDASFDFDTLELNPPFEHGKFIAAINAAVSSGYGVCILDSASHCWEGILEYKAKLDSRPGSNSYTNWNDAGGKFKGIIDAVLHTPIHMICCMRSKMDYVMESNDRGKTVPKKVGLAPIMHDGIEYEFTTVFDVALDHQAATSKDRSGLFTDKIFTITEDTGRQIALWLSTATPREMPIAADSGPQEASEPKSKGTPAERHQKAKDSLIEYCEAEQVDARAFLDQAAVSLGTVGEFPSFSDLPLEILTNIWKARKVIVSAMKQTAEAAA